MSNHSTVQASCQELFQEECRAFRHQLEDDALFLRSHPNDNSLKTTGSIYKSLIETWAHVERLREAGLVMASKAPKSPLVLQHHSYWFLRPLADQTEFEDECDRLESLLDYLTKRIYRREAENLWVAGLLEATSVHLGNVFDVFH